MFRWCHFNLQFLWISLTKRVKILGVYVQFNHDCVCQISIKSAQFYKSYSKRSRFLETVQKNTAWKRCFFGTIFKLPYLCIRMSKLFEILAQYFWNYLAKTHQKLCNSVLICIRYKVTNFGHFFWDRVYMDVYHLVTLIAYIWTLTTWLHW
jgi:hypothetical protein